MKRFLMKSMFFAGTILLLWVFVAPGCMSFRKADSEMIKEFSASSVKLETGTVPIDGKHIHFAKTGNDSFPTIVFVHGTPGSWDAFAGYMKDSALLSHFRMISIDRPGFGYSDFGKAVNLQRQSDLMSPVLKKLDNGKPMYLAGHSLGGPMIIKLAADHPDWYAGLVVISGSVDPAEEKPEKWRPWLFKTPLNLLIPGAFRPSNEELWYLKSDLIKLKNDFVRIHCPVVFIHGLADTWVPPGNVEYAKKLLLHAPSISELMLPGANHFIPWTRFNEIKSKLLELVSPGNNNSHTVSTQ